MDDFIHNELKYYGSPNPIHQMQELLEDFECALISVFKDINCTCATDSKYHVWGRRTREKSWYLLTAAPCCSFCALIMHHSASKNMDDDQGFKVEDTTGTLVTEITYYGTINTVYRDLCFNHK